MFTSSMGMDNGLGWQAAAVDTAISPQDHAANDPFNRVMIRQKDQGPKKHKESCEKIREEKPGLVR